VIGLDLPERVHIVGVGGHGMSGLAKLLAQAGHRVTGSDLKPGRVMTTLEALGVETWVGHRPEAAAAADLLVISSAVPDRDPEVRAATAAGIPVWERPRLLTEICSRMPALGATGTHGKTTTSAMLVTALRALGRDPSFMVGGQLSDLNTNAHIGEPGLFVLEADEAFGTFLDLALAGLIVTNIEPDHLDFYETVERLEAAFADVSRRVAGPVVACVDDPGASRLIDTVPSVVPYGTSTDAAWRIEDVEHAPGEISFTLAHGAERLPVTVPRPGIHIARDAAGVLALLGEMGLDLPAAAAGLAGFAGVRRRFEVRLRRRGIVVIDDYAHLPAEVATTIATAHMDHPGRVVAVFQPARYTRTARLAVEFGRALAAADRVIVCGIYAGGEAPIPGVTGRLIARAAAEAGGDVGYIARRADIAAGVVAEARPGDMVLLMGSGDITAVADEMASLLGDR